MLLLFHQFSCLLTENLVHHQDGSGLVSHFMMNYELNLNPLQIENI